MKPSDSHLTDDSSGPILVAGGGGFIGGQLVEQLFQAGARNVRIVDLKPLSEWSYRNELAENGQGDLRDPAVCRRAVEGVRRVFNLAADFGGVEYLERQRTECMLNVTINANLLDAASAAEVEAYFFASSACVYPVGRQSTLNVEPLREEHAYPADPEDGYGWEKLFSERLCRHFDEERRLRTHVARFHNVYGPRNPYIGPRAKAPAALCRKVIEAKLSGANEIEILGDGTQRRTFTYVSDAVDGILRLTASDVSDPLNVGSDEQVSINELVDLLEEIAAVRLRRRYVLDGPRGVVSRSSDNSRIREELDWAPSMQLANGMEQLYRWMHDLYVPMRHDVGLRYEQASAA